MIHIIWKCNKIKVRQSNQSVVVSYLLLINFSQVVSVLLLCHKVAPKHRWQLQFVMQWLVWLLAQLVRLKLRFALFIVENSGKSTFPIMKYQLQANAIAPLLARTISLGIALDDVKDEWLSIQKEQSQDQKRIMNMVTACCVIKESDKN